MVLKLELAGQKFGRLTVIEDDGTRTGRGEVFWLCRCDCGKEKRVITRNLRSGQVRSCGCLNDEMKRSRFLDLTDTETENFVIIDRSYSKNQRVYWNCICKHCGKHVVYNSNEIKRYTSCGCQRKFSDKERMAEISDPESLKTTKATAKSKTGVRGVYYRKNRGTYTAFINVNKKQVYLGESKNFDEAVRLRREAEKEYGYK